MTHSDDQGLVLPPRLAPTQVVIVPIFRNDDEKETVIAKAREIKRSLEDAGARVKLDASEAQRPGWKFHEYEVQGVPVRLALGPRDVRDGTIEMARRDTKTKENVAQEGIDHRVSETLVEIQQNLFDRALRYRDDNTTRVESYDEFKEVLDSKGGFIQAHWDGSEETEMKIKDDTKATIRCIPFHLPEEEGTDMISGRPSKQLVYFAKAY
jgi:prolyl-tRNA synthetase